MQVEEALAQAPGVAQVVCVRWEDKIVACVVPGPHGFVQEVCVELVEELLPEELRPGRYLFLSALPSEGVGAIVEVALKKRTVKPKAAVEETPVANDSPEATAYWKSQLDGFSPEPFPRMTGLKASAIRNVTETVTVAADITLSSVVEQAAALEATPLAAFQAAWGLILASYSDTMAEDVVFGSVLPGAAPVPTRIHLAGLSPESPATVRLVLQHLAASNAAAEQHVPVPVAAVLDPYGKLPYYSLLSFQGSVTAADVAVAVDVAVADDDRLELTATYKDEFLAQAGAGIMLRQMTDVLVHLLANPEATYTGVRCDVAPALRCTSNPHPHGVPEPADGSALKLHGQFEEHAATSPNDVALVFKYKLMPDP